MTYRERKMSRIESSQDSKIHKNVRTDLEEIPKMCLKTGSREEHTRAQRSCTMSSKRGSDHLRGECRTQPPRLTHRKLLCIVRWQEMSIILDCSTIERVR